LNFLWRLIVNSKNPDGGSATAMPHIQFSVLQEPDHRLPYRRSRGYLPHYEADQAPQMVTMRLHDSLPKSVLDRLVEELEMVDPLRREVERRSRIEEFLDNGIGSCWLSNASIGSVTELALLHFDNQRYTLHAWVI
jgi:hypothetical protein